MRGERHVRAWFAASAFALVGACSFDTSPNLDGTDGTGFDAGTVVSNEGRAVVDVPLPVSNPNASRAPTTTVPEGFGLSCSNVTCPVAPTGTEQCCTAATDVDDRRALVANVCGIDIGGGCFELEQPGVVDSRCPPAQPVGATSEEVGCCTAAGQCGTLNATKGIGCHYNPEIDQGCDQDIDRDVICETPGTYAIEAAVDVTWGGRNVSGLINITDSGRGNIVVRLLARIEEIGENGNFVAEIQPCQTVLPPFYSSVLCESYNAVFPDAIWDSASTPSFVTTGRVQCPNPGCILTFDPVTSLVGIDLDDPNGLWPFPETTSTFGCPSGQGLDCFPDHDADADRGITITLPIDGMAPAPPNATCMTGYTYRAPPLNANPFAIIGGVRRTERIQLGVRVRLGGSGRVDADCSTGLGGGIADFVESRAAGCVVQPGTANPFEPLAGPNTLCNAEEHLFIDQSLPLYTILRQGDAPAPALVIDDHSVSDGPRFSLKRMGDVNAAVTCADVRSAPL